MANRAIRRASIATYRRHEARRQLQTYLIAGNDAAGLMRNPLLANAAGIATRRCIACRAPFEGTPGGYLFSTPTVAAKSASVSTFCRGCFDNLPPAEIERHATRVLRRLVPGGKFERA